MHLRHIGTLLAISETGSFESAARQLGITTSAVSQRIKNLESEAGRVLVRRGNPAVPTEAGDVLVQAARQMELIEAEATSALMNDDAQLSIPLVVNADSLATWFKHVLRSTPNLHIFLEDETASLELLRRGECLGAITTESRPVTGCTSEYLGVMSYVPAAAPSFAARHRPSRIDRETCSTCATMHAPNAADSVANPAKEETSPAAELDWEHMPIVRFGPKDHLNNEYVRMIRPGFEPAASRKENLAPTFEAINDIIEAGHGWGVVPASIGHAYKKEGRFEILADEVLERPLYWQRWKVDSDALAKLTDQIHAAAAVGLG